MSLYSQEEICDGCYFSKFHTCCNKFCKCIIDKEDQLDYITGKCAYKMKYKTINNPHGKNNEK